MHVNLLEINTAVSVDLELNLRLCVSNKFLGADAAGLILQMAFSIWDPLTLVIQSTPIQVWLGACSCN